MAIVPGSGFPILSFSISRFPTIAAEERFKKKHIAQECIEGPMCDERALAGIPRRSIS